MADSALAAQEAAEAAAAAEASAPRPPSARPASGSADGRSPAPRSALSQALSMLGSAPPRGSLTVRYTEVNTLPCALRSFPASRGRVCSRTYILLLSTALLCMAERGEGCSAAAG